MSEDGGRNGTGTESSSRIASSSYMTNASKFVSVDHRGSSIKRVEASNQYNDYNWKNSFD
ncbi:unnamed protein product [Ectocarpus sp. 8 AP-2014]